MNKVSSLEVKYQTAEKEKQITQQSLKLQTQKAKIAYQRNTQLLLIGSLGFLLLGGLLFYNRNKAKQKQRLQNAILKEKEKGFAAVVKASEDERKRISKDLHDGIGQEMAALKMAIGHVKDKETDMFKKTELNKILHNCARSADEIRSISHQMMPRSLMEKGLLEAINDLLIGTFEFSDMKYKFEHFEVNERFDERIEISLYRVLQELINNVVKHAKASEVNVLLYKQENNLVLMIEDNGIGMQNKNKKGHGVLNIKSRVDMVNGTINYQPSSDSGTTAIIKVPL